MQLMIVLNDLTEVNAARELLALLPSQNTLAGIEPSGFSEPLPDPAAVFAPPPTPPAPELEQPNVTPPAVDSRGLPWDERIHASTKSLLVSGEWKLKRGVAPELVQEVEAELSGRSDEDATLARVMTPEPPALPATPTPPAPQPSALLTEAPVFFVDLMKRLTPALAAGTLPQNALGLALSALGIPSIITVQQDASLVPLVWNQIVAANPGAGL